MRGLTLFLTGAAIGAGAALVLAPKTGHQTRRDLKKFSKKAMDQLDTVTSNVRDYVEDGTSRLRQAVNLGNGR